jgi:ElaB/YqjD/DUF883 family membrane-anchored ribosome-binding protein
MAQKPDDDIAAIAEQLSTLRRDFGTLATLVKETAEARGDAAGRRIAAKLDETASEARARALGVRSEAEGAIVQNPVMAVGMALGLGMLLGMIFRR